jgi:hypothetical protein
MLYFEGNCTVEYQGRKFTQLGAAIGGGRVIAYLGDNHKLTDWHGMELGTWREISSWRQVSSKGMVTTIHQVEVMVDGLTYTGRSQGKGTIFHGKLKVKRRDYGHPCQ